MWVTKIKKLKGGNLWLNNIALRQLVYEEKNEPISTESDKNVHFLISNA